MAGQTTVEIAHGPDAATRPGDIAMVNLCKDPRLTDAAVMTSNGNEIWLSGVVTAPSPMAALQYAAPIFWQTIQIAGLASVWDRWVEVKAKKLTDP